MIRVLGLVWNSKISSTWALKSVHSIPSSVAPWSFARRVAKKVFPQRPPPPQTTSPRPLPPQAKPSQAKPSQSQSK